MKTVTRTAIPFLLFITSLALACDVSIDKCFIYDSVNCDNRMNDPDCWSPTGNPSSGQVIGTECQGSTAVSMRINNGVLSTFDAAFGTRLIHVAVYPFTKQTPGLESLTGILYPFKFSLLRNKSRGVGSDSKKLSFTDAPFTTSESDNPPSSSQIESYFISTAVCELHQVHPP